MKLTFEKLKNLDFVSNEAYKTLRTNITFCGDDVRVIAVTSSTPNEGKTNVTFNLARAFAEDNKRILFNSNNLTENSADSTNFVSYLNAVSHLLFFLLFDELFLP